MSLEDEGTKPWYKAMTYMQVVRCELLHLGMLFCFLNHEFCQNPYTDNYTSFRIALLNLALKQPSIKSQHNWQAQQINIVYGKVSLVCAYLISFVVVNNFRCRF